MDPSMSSDTRRPSVPSDCSGLRPTTKRSQNASIETSSTSAAAVDYIVFDRINGSPSYQLGSPSLEIKPTDET